MRRRRGEVIDMDFGYGPAAEAFRADVRGFLAEYLPPGWAGIGRLSTVDRAEFLPAWRRELVERGLLAPSVPSRLGGGGHGPVEEAVAAEEFARAGVPQFPGPNDELGLRLLVPTLMRWGTDTQVDHFVRATIAGEIRWAQAYSEPEAGSDLFGLRTRAVLEGRSWVVNGRKIWQTGALTANWLFALVRTDPNAVRSHGISFLLLPVDQEGIEIRGIRNIADVTEFCEVLLDNARTGEENVVGGVDNGAKVALTLLGFERVAAAVGSAASFQVELERLVRLARATGADQDPVARQRIAACWTSVVAIRSLALQCLGDVAAGRAPGPESSVLKLITGEYRRTVTDLAVDLIGPGVLVPAGEEPIETLSPQPLGLDPVSSRAWVADFLHARAATIYGGSNEIQRNTIAEQILGLPRESRPA